MNQLDITGRLLPDTACDEMILNNHALQFQPAIQINHTTIHCTRCASDCEKAEAQLPDETYFCYQCFNLGRLDSSMKLVHLPGINQFEVVHPVLTWKGRLTELQQKCSDEVVKAFQEHQNKLLWAVTGAGKTEISFAGIAWALAQGLRVEIASPRVDVCVELYPRYQAAFANTSMILLHGKSEEPYQYRQLTICTTHQLLRFQDAFDVLIIDEVDAFPYANNDSLQMAAKRSVKKHGSLLLMTAPPVPSYANNTKLVIYHFVFIVIYCLKLKFIFALTGSVKSTLTKSPKKSFLKSYKKLNDNNVFSCLFHELKIYKLWTKF